MSLSPRGSSAYNQRKSAHRREGNGRSGQHHHHRGSLSAVLDGGVGAALAMRSSYEPPRDCASIGATGAATASGFANGRARRRLPVLCRDEATRDRTAVGTATPSLGHACSPIIEVGVAPKRDLGRPSAARGERVPPKLSRSRIWPLRPWISSSLCWLRAISRAAPIASAWVVWTEVARSLPAPRTDQPPSCGTTCWFLPMLIFLLPRAVG